MFIYCIRLFCLFIWINPVNHSGWSHGMAAVRPTRVYDTPTIYTFFRFIFYPRKPLIKLYPRENHNFTKKQNKTTKQTGKTLKKKMCKINKNKWKRWTIEFFGHRAPSCSILEFKTKRHFGSIHLFHTIIT